MSSVKPALPKVVSQEEWLAARNALLRQGEGTHARVTRSPQSVGACRWREWTSSTCSPAERGREPAGSVRRQAAAAAVSLHVRTGRARLADGRLSRVFDVHRQHRPVHTGASEAHAAFRWPSSRAHRWRTSRRIASGMSWPHRWVSSEHNSFNVDFGMTTPEEERHGLSVFLRDGDDIYRTYFTSQRGTEVLGNIWGFLEATRTAARKPGRLPPGWPANAALSVVAEA